MQPHLIALALTAALAACGGDDKAAPTTPGPTPAPADEYKQDLEKICNSPALSGAPANSGLAGVGPWLEKNVVTDKARALLDQLAIHADVEPARAEVAAHGIAPCPLLDPAPTP